MFTGTPEQVNEALDLMQEECAEIIQIISKIRRFGYDSYHPADPDKKSNRDLFHDEIGDFQLLYRLLEDAGLIDWEKINLRQQEKLPKLRKYTNLFS